MFLIFLVKSTNGRSVLHHGIGVVLSRKEAHMIFYKLPEHELENSIVEKRKVR